MEDYLDAQDYILDMEQGLEKIYNYLYNEFINIRAGRANPHILDKVKIDYYGTLTPLNQLGNISVPEARMLMISLWDQSIIKDVIRAIQESDIGINPMDDGKIIRLVFPMLTEERRKEICKNSKQLVEGQKVQMRNVRRDCMEQFKKMKKDGVMSEDDFAMYEKEVQEILDKNILKLEKAYADKEKEIMEI